MARIRELYRQFRQHHEASKAQSDFSPRAPMTAGQAEYWAKMSHLKDAHEITEEQHSFRRKVASDLDAVRPDDAGREVA